MSGPDVKKIQILEMLREGQITVEEAERLLAAANEPNSSEEDSTEVSTKAYPKNLRVVVQDGEDDVNITIPLKLIAIGRTLSNVLPNEVNSRMREKGVDLETLGAMKNEEIYDAMRELNIRVKDGSNATVQIYCE